MAEKKATKATEKKAAAPKAEKKAAAPKKCATKKAAVPAVSVTCENVGFRAGDVYQALASAQKALSVKEIAKQANISETEVLLGTGWLMKEGKVKGENDLIVLA